MGSRYKSQFLCVFIPSQVLDFDPDTGNEEVVVYNSDRINIGSNTKLWRIPQDLVDFPVVSTTTTLTIMLRVHGLRSGRLAFAVLSRELKKD